MGEKLRLNGPTKQITILKKDGRPVHKHLVIAHKLDYPSKDALK